MAITKIATVTVDVLGAASIDFTSIPGTYTDLFIVLSARTGSGSAWDDCKIEFNGVTTGYSGRWLAGTGSATASGIDSTLDVRLETSAQTASTFSSSQIYIPNYAGSTTKSLSIETVEENNATAAGAFITAALSTATAAVSSIKLTPTSSFVQYSSATLYGITKGSSGGVTVS